LIADIWLGAISWLAKNTRKFSKMHEFLMAGATPAGVCRVMLAALLPVNGKYK